MTSRLLLLAAAVAALVLVAGAGRAAAGTYTVTSCHAADGSPLPVSDAGGGWRPEYGAGRSAEDRCAGGPGLLATVGGNVPVELGGQALWRFVPPAGTFVSGFRIAYSGYARPYDDVNRGIVGIADSERGSVVRHEGAGDVATVVATAAGRHDEWVAAYGNCDGPAGHPPCPRDVLHARIAMERSVIELTDGSPPSSGTATGSAASDAGWDGTERLAVPVRDAGGGLWRWSLAVDGADALGGPVDPGSATCRTDRAFVTPRPCPLDADLLLDLDTEALPAGTHDVTVRVADAAGNQRTVFSARRTIAGVPLAPEPGVAVAPADPSPGAGRPAAARLTARWARTRARTLSIAYGARPAIRGRLTRPGGAPLRGAPIALLVRTAGRGRAADAGGTRTRPDGTFTLVLRAGLPSSVLDLRYRPVAAARAVLHLRVRAGLTLRAVRRGPRSVLLGGHLRGRPLPRGGKLVELQARDRSGRWLTFRTVRSGPRGRFRLRYRFRTRRPATFALRARTRAAGDYPYATGASAPVRVRVG